MNRTEIQTKLGAATSALLREKGFISPVDVFLRLGCLDPKDHEAWRHGRVPCLEAVIQGSLGKINFIMATLRRNSLQGGLKPSWTAYRSWGKRGGKVLQFSKSGAPHLEMAYATHYVKTTLTEFRGHASGMLTRVEHGETLVVLRHGRPIAEVSPVARPGEAPPSWKRPALRLATKGAGLASAILEERAREGVS